MRARASRKTGMLAQFVCIMLLLLLLVGILLSEVLRTSATFFRESATVVSVEETTSLVGYVFREETVLESEYMGPVDYAAAQGEAVTAGKLLATVYQDDSNTGTRECAKKILAEAELLCFLRNADSVPDYYGAWSSLMQRLADSTAMGGEAAADELLSALCLHAAVRDETDYDARLAELDAEFAELIKNAGAGDALAATGDGVFVRAVDGFEGLMTPAALDMLTPGGLRAMLASPQSTEQAVGKVVVNGTWYLAVPLAKKEAAAFEIGKAYAATLCRSKEELRFVPERVTAEDSTGEVVLILRAEGSLPPADLGRRLELSLVTGKVSGIRVPMQALRTEDDGLAVYIDVNGYAVRRRVEAVLYRDGYCLALPSDKDGYLREGENMIVTERRIYEGKAL